MSIDNHTTHNLNLELSSLRKNKNAIWREREKGGREEARNMRREGVKMERNVLHVCVCVCARARAVFLCAERTIFFKLTRAFFLMNTKMEVCWH